MVRYSCASLRRFFGVRINEEAEVLHDLNAVQVSSYNNFVSDSGIGEVFRSVFPIKNEDSSVVLDVAGSVSIKPDIFNADDCVKKGVTYSSALRAKLKLSIFEESVEGDDFVIKSQKEQDVYMGDIPRMTDRGTFIINGTEKVVVSQVHRSPGVFFTHDDGKGSSSGKCIYSARVIPYRGPWLDFEFSSRGLLYFRIDRKRKIPVTTLLRAMGYDDGDILSTFYDGVLAERVGERWKVEFIPQVFNGVRLPFDLVDAESENIVIKKGVRLSETRLNSLSDRGLRHHILNDDDMTVYYLRSDVHSEEGEVIFPLGSPVTAEMLHSLRELDIKKLDLMVSMSGDPFIRDTLFADKITDHATALFEIYKVVRNGEALTKEVAEQFFFGLFFDSLRYDLSEVGRYKLNNRLNLDFDLSICTLQKEDIIAVIRKLVDIANNLDDIDDIDNLGNRRIRSVGEFFENHIRIGLLRMQKASIERMSGDLDSILPHDLINAKLLVSSIKEFFNSSQLSQFMDQTNPLSAITHRRRLSALGPGGLTRDRAGFEVRDVHTTYYGRICPIETPEGQNIGLINSLAIYARVNKYGFIESPFYKVKNGVVTREVEYLSAMKDAVYNIAQAGAALTKDRRFVDEMLYCRRSGNLVMVNRNDIDYMDVSQKQIVSVAASLIPFLENDDTSRALMGSNMQRQAVPLLSAQTPFIGTGMESVVARGADSMILAKNHGIVDKVDGKRIVVRRIDPENGGCTGVDLYGLSKFRKSNHGTCLNQTPIVTVGEVVKKGDVIADGSATEKGDLALGRNLLVAFLSWKGYNFADSIVMSKDVVHNDCFTSIHIEEFECVARDTRLGAEEITKDVPNVNDESLYHIDESGIVRIGSIVKSGEILVAKATPKGESFVTPEEKLLRTIFGAKSDSTRDASLYVPPGVEGTVVDVQILAKNSLGKSDRVRLIYEAEVADLKSNHRDSLNVLESSVRSAISQFIIGAKLKSGAVISSDDIENMDLPDIWALLFEDDAITERKEKLKVHMDDMFDYVEDDFKNKLKKLNSNDDLPHGTLQVVKVFVAIKRKLQVGDKMAGRHGNKGVVSIISPVEDMPFLEDGTPVDVVLNPLGVPSRMNVGQILETHLGLASYAIGRKLSDLLDRVDSIKNHFSDSIEEEEDDNDQDNSSNLAELFEGLRSLLLKLFDDDSVKHDDIKNMNDDDIYEFSSRMKKGIYFATPVFEGPNDSKINDALSLGDMPSSGQVVLRDGQTGETFDRPVTIGYMYVLKLHHLVDEKIHARSVGTYSLVTQQPLGGKSHFGGQRFGEMECWALQAYGAAYTLQEMLTIKSDDVFGRVRIYDYIVKGHNNKFSCGLPESFHVLVNELKALCLSVDLLNDDEE